MTNDSKEELKAKVWDQALLHARYVRMRAETGSILTVNDLAAPMHLLVVALHPCPPMDELEKSADGD